MEIINLNDLPIEIYKFFPLADEHLLSTPEKDGQNIRKNIKNLIFTQFYGYNLNITSENLTELVIKGNLLSLKYLIFQGIDINHYKDFMFVEAVK